MSLFFCVVFLREKVGVPVFGGIRTSGAGAGLFGPPGAMPTRSWNNSHYFRDVVFVAMP